MSLLDTAGAVTGDIWCSGAFSFESPLKDLLDSGNYTLEDLLGEDELLQELRGVHPDLVEFFSTPQAVAGLVRYIILPPNGTIPVADEENGEKQTAPISLETADNDQTGEDAEIDKPLTIEDGEPDEDPRQNQRDTMFVRYPYMACEVVCCEIDSIIDTLVLGMVPSTKDHVGDEGENVNAELGAYVKNGDEGVTPVAAGPESILDLLFSLLFDSKEGEMDDYRAGYFDKVLSVLFRKRPQEMSNYINQGGNRSSPELMAAMFRHLYSHSIMQILQRLLLPQPPPPPPPPPLPGPEGQGPDAQEEYPDEYMHQPTDGVDYFRCDWSGSGSSLEILLQCLVSERNLPANAEDEELSMSLYQNASEVLITIIQNSPLTSPTLHALTTDPILYQLTKAATQLEDVNDFSPHDSKLTCTLNVLESLILQLGGYGSVGTVIATGEQDPEGAEPFESPQFAVSTTLISHLPQMLQSLQDLLLCPSAHEWRSTMQFSRSSPTNILGSSRLRIVRLLESLVLLGDPNVDSVLCQSECLVICLDLFWKFQWCSMLHQSVANLLVHVFEGADARSELQEYFMGRCNLMGRLMDSFLPKLSKVSSASELAVSTNADNIQGQLDGDRETAENSHQSGSSGEASGELESVADVPPEPTNSPTSAIPKVESLDVTRDSGSGLSDPIPPQSNRLGYMGHVIIICQALVHACNEDPEQQDEFDVDEHGAPMHSIKTNEPRRNNGQDETDPFGSNLPHQEKTDQDRSFHVNGEASSNKTLYLAGLIESHSLCSKWNEFVNSTLATETSVQSTPLGGFHMSPLNVDPLHSHRPGLVDSDGVDGDDDGSAPTMPERSAYEGGGISDVDDHDIANMMADMDENDLDVAASMMAGLNLQRSADDNLIPTVENYDFDDPLGNRRFADFGDFDKNGTAGVDDDGSNGSNSQSSSDDDEDSNISETTKDSGDSGNVVVEGVPVQGEGSSSLSNIPQAPVMNLFAGNFESFDQDVSSSNQPASGWSDFANFEDAFAGSPSTDNDAAFAAFGDEAAPVQTGDKQETSSDNDADDIFGSGHSSFNEAFETVDEQDEKSQVDDVFEAAGEIIDDENRDEDLQGAQSKVADTESEPSDPALA